MHIRQQRFDVASIHPTDELFFCRNGFLFLQERNEPADDYGLQGFIRPFENVHH